MGPLITTTNIFLYQIM